MVQLILTLIFYIMMAGILIFVWLMWRGSVSRTQLLEKALVDTALKATDAAKQASDTARSLARVVEETHKGEPP